MSQLRVQTRIPVNTRVCLACGYSGTEIQRNDEAAVFECPCCGQDLYARRPMSYAEMEGLTGARRAAAAARLAMPKRRVSRWRRVLSWLRLATR